jgi:O-antigen ligase
MNVIGKPPFSQEEGSPILPPESGAERSALDRIEFLLAGLVTFFAPMNFFRLESVYFTLSDAFAVLFLVMLAFNRSVPTIRLGAATTIWSIGAAMLMVFLLVSSAMNGDAERGLIVVGQYFYAFVVLPLVFFTRTREELLTLMKVFCISVFIICVHGMYVIHIDGQRLTHFVTGSGRLQSLVERTNETGALIALTLPLLLYLKSIGRVSAITLLVFSLSYLYAVALTGSNSGFVGLLFGLAIYSAVSMSWRVILIATVAAVGIVALTIGYGDLFLPEAFRERVLVALVSGDIRQAGTYSDRLELIKESLEVVNRTPFLGVGADQYRLHSETGQPVHNAYLLIWSEGGLPALVGFLLILTSALYISVKTFRPGGDNATFAASISVVLLFAVFINSVAHMYGRFWVVPLLFATAMAWRFQLDNLPVPSSRQHGTGAGRTGPSRTLIQSD